MTDTSTDKTPPLGIDWVRTIAGALAAVSTTVLLSTLGAAGTLLGAAVGSLVATVATALYSLGLDRSRSRVRELSALRVGSVPRGRAEPEPSDDAAGNGWLESLRRLGWRRLLVPALATFLVVIAAVTVFELAAGRTLASTVRGGSSGGTTLSHVTGSGGGGSQQPTPPTGGATPDATPDSEGSTPTPSATPSDEPTGTPAGEPTSTTSPSVQTAPTETPQPTFGATPSVPTSPGPQPAQ